MPTSQVDPDNGPGTDYTSLQAWEDAKDDATSGTEIAECHGGTGQLGTVMFANWSGATFHVKPAAGEAHDGTISGSSSAARISTSTNVNAIADGAGAPNDGIIERLYVTDSASSRNTAMIDVLSLGSPRIDGCLVEFTGTTGGNFALVEIGANDSKAWNNYIAMLSTNMAHSVRAIRNGSGTTGVTLYHNTCHDNSSGAGSPIGIQFRGTVTVRNNVCTDFPGGDFVDSGTETASDNASSDASAPGTGSITNITATDEFVDPDDSAEIKSASQLKDAGFDLSGTVDADLIATSRPQGSGHDIGAWELVAAAAGHPAIRRLAQARHIAPVVHGARNVRIN